MRSGARPSRSNPPAGTSCQGWFDAICRRFDGLSPAGAGPTVRSPSPIRSRVHLQCPSDPLAGTSYQAALREPPGVFSPRCQLGLSHHPIPNRAPDRSSQQWLPLVGETRVRPSLVRWLARTSRASAPIPVGHDDAALRSSSMPLERIRLDETGHAARAGFLWFRPIVTAST